METPRRLDLNVALLSSWLVGGIFADGWEHGHSTDGGPESFFTPWHIPLYSGLLAVLAYLLGTVWLRHRRMGGRWADAIPRGYELSVLGVIIFFVSGIGDMTWHIVFGFERSISAAFSPPHLGIMIGIALIITGPIRACWRRHGDPAGWREWTPLLLSLSLIATMMTFYTQYANPLVVIQATSLAGGSESQALGGASIYIHSALVMGWILLALRRWNLPVGSITFILTWNTFCMSFLAFENHFFLIPGAVLAGICGDYLLWKLHPRSFRPLAFHLFAFLVPVIYFAFYFAAVFAVKGIAWPVPLWSGTIFMAGMCSLLVSLLIQPSTWQEQQRAWA